MVPLLLPPCSLGKNSVQPMPWPSRRQVCPAWWGREGSGRSVPRHPCVVVCAPERVLGCVKSVPGIILFYSSSMSV